MSEPLDRRDPTGAFCRVSDPTDIHPATVACGCHGADVTLSVGAETVRLTPEVAVAISMELRDMATIAADAVEADSS